MRYTICIEETVVQEFTVEAESEEAALKNAEKLYKAGVLVLEPGEVQDVKINIAAG